MSDTNKPAQTIVCAFARLRVCGDDPFDASSGWPCAQMPGSAAFLGTGKAVKVAGTVGGHPYEASTLPVGNGTHMMPIRAPFGKALGRASAMK